ncbi:hypothetical protein Kkor_1216 [Kangiella koreensis DSM 16069]|uniref:Uncharacterized protein n=1 Tax=Kangiella koreensis (strain DSM 16069 / JCM 12317 / KCTC 12182 / SW-125) TaxID=523791 RepID=C7RBJ3_KANKD|nr:hypothetical protein Kkor_1216 [Kangiella koreensis DSM 16069]
MFEFYLQDAELVNLFHAKKYDLNSSTTLSTTKEKTMTQLNNQDRQKCEVWTRVMGYHRPVSAFNKGKQSEHKERQHFKERA